MPRQCGRQLRELGAAWWFVTLEMTEQISDVVSNSLTANLKLLGNASAWVTGSDKLQDDSRLHRS
jgi:hypothetical protein